MKLRYLTDSEIEEGILQVERSPIESYPEGVVSALDKRNSGIRLAYAWLDAQPKTTGLCESGYELRHVVREWAGLYICNNDLVVAASLHPEIRGSFPCYNISSSLVYPSRSRKEGIEEAGTQCYGKGDDLWTLRDYHQRIETIEDGEFVIYRLPYGRKRKRSKALIERNARINAREFGDKK